MIRAKERDARGKAQAKVKAKGAPRIAAPLAQPSPAMKASTAPAEPAKKAATPPPGVNPF